MKKIIHIFGMTNTGKTTLAKAIKQRLSSYDVQHIDADDYRLTTNADLGFSTNDRIENVRRLQAIADSSTSEIVILTAVTPFEVSRSAGNINVLLVAPLEELLNRDTKGVYSRQSEVAGVSSPFDPSQYPHLTLDTLELCVELCIDEVLNYAGIKPKYAMFVGRWQTLHAGHDWLFNQRLDKGESVLICIRDVPKGPKDLLTAEEVKAEMQLRYSPLIEAGRMKLLTIPDISSINYGRDVGYEVVRHEPPEEIKQISGSSIRKTK